MLLALCPPSLLGSLPCYCACPGTQRMTSPLQCNSARAPCHVAVFKILQLWLNVDQKYDWDGYRVVSKGWGGNRNLSSGWGVYCIKKYTPWMRWDQGPAAQMPTSSPPWVSDLKGEALGWGNMTLRGAPGKYRTCYLEIGFEPPFAHIRAFLGTTLGMNILTLTMVKYY